MVLKTSARTAVALLSVTVGVSTVSALPAPALGASTDGLIAYTNAEGVNVVRPDGTAQRLLTTNAAEIDLSPDGSKIVFIRYTPDGQSSDVYVMNVDGTNERRLTTDDAWDATPRWSPDGTRIALARQASPANMDIFVMEADGSSLRNVSNDPEAPSERQPVWSPDGQRLAFLSDRLADPGDFECTVRSSGGIWREQ